MVRKISFALECSMGSWGKCTVKDVCEAGRQIEALNIVVSQTIVIMFLPLPISMMWEGSAWYMKIYKV